MKGLSEEQNKRCKLLGVEIYNDLLEKYPPETEGNLDIIMNSLTHALICLGFSRWPVGKEREYATLIGTIVFQNLIDNRERES